MRAPQIFLFLGLACPPSVLLTSVMLRGARSSPGDQIPPQFGQLSGGPSRRHALVLGCPRAAWERRQEI